MFDHPPCGPDLAPNDFHLFTHMKKWIASQHFDDDNKLQNSMKDWLHNQVAEIYEEGIYVSKTQ